MPDLPEPSDWAKRHFGEHWEAIATGLLYAGASAHERALSAKDASRLNTNEPYGSTYWLALPQEVVHELGTIPTIAVIRPKGARYSLATIGDSLLFPFRFGNRSKGVDGIRLRPSSLRARIMAIRDFPGGDVQDPIDFGPAFTRPNDPARLAETQGSIKRTISVAFDCEPRVGLRHIYIGEADFDEKSGRVIWLYREEVPLTAIREQNRLFVLANPDYAPFDAAPMPSIDLQARHSDATIPGGAAQ